MIAFFSALCILALVFPEGFILLLPLDYYFLFPISLISLFLIPDSLFLIPYYSCTSIISLPALVTFWLSIIDLNLLLDSYSF